MGSHKDDKISTEELFDSFVRSTNGILLKEEFPKTPGFLNADYWFPDRNVIVELKTFATNFPTQAKYLDQLARVLNEWLQNGRITEADLDNGSLPMELNVELIRVFRKPVKGILEKANRQIKSTRSELNRPDARGVVILMNDGLYDLKPDAAFILIGDILTHLFSGIEAYVYCTLRRRVLIPGHEDPSLLWLSSYRQSDDKELSEFITELGRRWFAFLELIVGPFKSRNETYDPFTGGHFE